MVWVPDSRVAGYLGPRPAPAPGPLNDDDYEDFLHDVFAGITGLDPTLVRPMWPQETANQPDFSIDWMAFGVTDAQLDFDPAVIHVDDGGLGYDALQEHEVDTIQCSFIGPHAGRYASLLRRGFYINQNRAKLREHAIGLVEVQALNRVPELIRQQWLNRIDVNVILRREIRYDYSVCNISRAQGPITASNWADDIFHREFDTGDVELQPQPREDEGLEPSNEE